MVFGRRAPPPPPPPPPSPSPSAASLVLVAAALAVLGFLLLLLRRRRPANPKPLISSSSLGRQDTQRSALVTFSSSPLGEQACRLLAGRGYKVDYSTDALLPNGARPQLVVHLAREAPGPVGPARTTAKVAAQCERLPVPPQLVVISDACVGCDPMRDVSDGDIEMEDPDHSHCDPRLEALLVAEERAARYAASTGTAAIVLRPHRIYGPQPPSAVSLLYSGATALLGGARAYTSLTHIEHAALAAVRAADELFDAAPAAGSVSKRIVTDGAIYSISHLLRCVSVVLRVPPPLLPLARVLRPLFALFAPRLGRALRTHQFFVDTRPADTAAAPAEAALRHALGGWEAGAGPLVRLVAPLYTAALCALAAAALTSLPADALEPLPMLAVPSALVATAAAVLLYALLPAASSLPRQGKLLPVVVDGGLPLIGHGLDFVKGPVFLVTRLRQQYRSVFTTTVATQRITFMQGPEAQRSFIKATDKELDQGPVYQFTIPVFGRNIVYDSPLDERTQQVKLVVHSMNTKSLDAMVPKIIEEAEMYFANEWGDEDVVDLRETFAGLIILTASATLMGPEVRSNLVQDVARIYHKLDSGLTPFSVFFPHAPTKAHRARDAARQEMVEIFSKVIKSRREAAERGERRDDFLQSLIDFRYKDTVDKRTGTVTKKGVGYTDDEIVGFLIVLLFAGQHTSSITSAWLGAMLLSHPDELDKVKKEQEKLVGAGGKLNYDVLLSMDGMRRAISETLRLYPPLILLIRKVMIDREVGPFTIPKGDIVMMCMPAGNKDPRYWSNPEAFSPDRFAAGSPEADTWSSRTVEHGADNGKMLSFGGGHHMCSGRRFGFLQVSAIWSILLRDFDLELVSEVPVPNYEDMVVGPKGPILVRYKRKVKKAATRVAAT